MKELDIILAVLCFIDAFFLWGSNFAMQGRGLKFPLIVPLMAGVFLAVYLIAGHTPAEIAAMAARENNPELFDFVLKLFGFECIAAVAYHAFAPIHSKPYRVTVTTVSGPFGATSTYVKSFDSADDALAYETQSWTYKDVTNVKLDFFNKRELKKYHAQK